MAPEQNGKRSKWCKELDSVITQHMHKHEDYRKVFDSFHFWCDLMCLVRDFTCSWDQPSVLGGHVKDQNSFNWLTKLDYSYRTSYITVVAVVEHFRSKLQKYDSEDNIVNKVWKSSLNSRINFAINTWAISVTTYTFGNKVDGILLFRLLLER